MFWSPNNCVIVVKVFHKDQWLYCINSSILIVNILLNYGSGANKLRFRDRNVYQCDVVAAIYPC